ncbi:DUF362 domain-containing protein [Phycicoccus sp. Root101]|uniref:DUF362 domain-containing protein n=1 Tax=Phycicoccus sp. Root101 TaxID=1736421 RepID=UPI00138F4415|nr:DUF362 domain-containing protein [Phycicoccus sp. Root101]
MAPARVPSGNPVAGTVVAGGGLASLAAAVAQVAPAVGGHAVVLTRLSQPTPVASAVVHELVDLLVERGAGDVTIGFRLRAHDRDRGHDSVVELARLAGLGGRTPRGHSYDVVDLAINGDHTLAPPASVLHGCAVSTVWAGAGTRVLLGRAVTDLLDRYAAALDPFLRAGEEVAGAAPADVVADLLDLVPPQLVVVDALEAAVGPDGGRLPRLLDTGTLVVGTDVLAVDGAVAGLLGQDRSSSRLFAGALARRRTGPGDGRVHGFGDGRGGPSTRSGVLGAVVPFAGTHGPHPAARAAAVRLAADPELERVLSASIGGPDPGAAPADPVLAVVRAVLTPLVEAAADGVGAFALSGVVDAVAATAHGVRAWQTGLDKSAVPRRVVPLGFDPGSLDGSAYDGLPEFFAEFDALVGAKTPPAGGDEALRWRVVDGATVFETTRDLPADFDAFVARVDVAAGISLMADYLGGRRVTVPGGAPGTTRQAERNLYLPQPNYLALWGGEPIDVCKVELVERGPEEHRLTWRTLHSPNGSAVFDDGSLTFSRSARGTLVRVRGRQLFSLPPSWAGIDLAALPELREPLLEEAYRRFFTTTFDNLEACFEGREFRIGRPPTSPTDPLLTRSLELLLGAARSWVDDRAPEAARPDSADVDLHGFHHVRGSR